MTSYRIYGELYCALKGGFLNEIKQRLSGCTLADIVDEINSLRRIKYYDPMSPTSARTLLGVLLESQWWSNWKNHTDKDRLPFYSDNIPRAESNRILHEAPLCLVSSINSFLSPMDSCKLKWTIDPVIKIDVCRVKSGLNSTIPVRVELAASKIQLLSKAQSIIYLAQAWLCHSDIINLLKAIVQCTSTKSKCIYRARGDNYRPLLSPLPVCNIG